MGQKIFSFACLAAFFSGSHAAPQLGELAPEFRLQDQNYEWHSLADYKGKWVVLYFYPKADTPGCTTEACEFRDNIFAFDEFNAQVLGVSVDDVASQSEFAEKYHLPFPLLSDSGKDVAREYDVMGMLFASRQSFIIAPDGRIAKHYENVRPAEHTNEVLDDLRALTVKN
jgi:peroxiredoxin Q/BCP